MPKTLATAAVDRLLHHRPHLSDQRRQRPAHPSTHRPRGEPIELTTPAGESPPRIFVAPIVEVRSWPSPMSGP